MFNTKMDYLIGEYMIYCRSRQLREKTMLSYEQALRLFEKWCKEELNIDEEKEPSPHSISYAPSYQPDTPFFLIHAPRSVWRTSESTSPGSTAGR